MGIGVGILFHCYLAVFGISTLIISNEIAADIVSIFGSLYLIFLGFSSFIDSNDSSERSQLLNSSFLNGFITNIFNIKAFIFFISLFSIIFNQDISFIGKLFIPLYFAIATTLWFSFLAFVITQDNVQRRWEPIQEIINKISGFILIIIGILILLNIF